MYNPFFRTYFNSLYPNVYKYYNQLKSQEKFTKDQLQAFQLNKLNFIIDYARTHTKFYRNLWNEYGVPRVLMSLSDFDKYPIVTKEMLIEALKSDEIVPDLFKSKKLYYSYTTGSTGSPFSYPIDNHSSARRVALELRSFDWYKFRIGHDRRLKLWRSNLKTSTKDVIRELMYNQKTFSIYDPKFPEQSQLNSERAEHLINILNKFKPSNIDGFVSALTFLAKYIVDNNIKLEFNLNSVVAGAEYLSNGARKLMEAAYNVPIYNRYGGTESGLIAHETEQESNSNHFLHISSDSIYTELYKDSKPIFDGEGMVVFTDFSCLSMPFIKYINGDVAKFDKKASSSSQLPFNYFTEIKGRINDYFLLPNGSLLSSHIWHNYFREATFIKQFQIIQEELNLVIVYYVLSINEKTIELKLLELKNKVINALPGCTVYWVEKNSIDFGPGGKFRHSLSKLKIDLNSLI